MQLMLLAALYGRQGRRDFSKHTQEDMNRNVNNSFSPINFWGSCLVHSFLSHCTFLNYIWWAQRVLEGFVTVRARLLYAHVSRSLLSEGVGRISSELNVIDLKESKGSYIVITLFWNCYQSLGGLNPSSCPIGVQRVRQASFWTWVACAMICQDIVQS